MFSQILKELRANRGINQIQLAHEMGVSQATIGKWETGIRVPDAEMLSKLADFFCVSVDHLLGKEALDLRVVMLARDFKKLPDEDKDFLFDNFKNTMDIYFKTKGKSK